MGSLCSPNSGALSVWSRMTVTPFDLHQLIYMSSASGASDLLCKRYSFFRDEKLSVKPMTYFCPPARCGTSEVKMSKLTLSPGLYVLGISRCEWSLVALARRHASHALDSFEAMRWPHDSGASADVLAMFWRRGVAVWLKRSCSTGPETSSARLYPP